MAKVAQVKEARTARVRDIMARSPEVTADDQATAAHLVISTIEVVVHHLLAGSEPIEPERLETQVIKMLSRYLMGAGRRIWIQPGATAALVTASFAGQSVYSVEQDRSTYTVEPVVSLDIPRTASTEQLDSGPLRVPFTCTL